MSDSLRAHFGQRVQLTKTEFETCAGFFIPKKVRKRQFLLREGEVCRHMAFVESGCLREYAVDGKGNEHVFQFAIADWWISDAASFLAETPATNNIDALNDSDVLLLSKPGRDEMLKTVPKIERYFRILLESNFISMHKRINDSLGAPADERYLIFLNTYPKLIGQISQNQIASYLGITPQSLSRIRRELLLKR